jgi:ribonuclease HI
MRVVVAGSRGEHDYGVVCAAIRNSGFDISVVISGRAKGVDRLGERWAKENGVQVDPFPADWSLGKAAGHIRNRQMLDTADALIAVWDGQSPGTRGGIEYARSLGIPVHVEITSQVYTVYADGASRKDRRGGWGALILRDGAPDVELVGGDYDTTNNRMELMGPIEVMWYLPPSYIEFVCDSEYVIKGATEYLPTWEYLGWRTTSNKPLKNDDLWKELKLAMARHREVRWTWVKGHSGDPGNERADALADMGIPPAV